MGDDSSTFGSIGDFASSAYDSAADAVSGAYDSAAETVSTTYDSAAETVSTAYDSAAETVSSAYDSAAETVSTAYDSAAETVSGAYESTAEAVSGAYDSASDAASATGVFLDDYAQHGIGQAMHDSFGTDQREVDKIDAVAWDVAGIVPGVSTEVAIVGGVLDAGAGIYDEAVGNDAAARSRLHAAELDAIGAVPDLGTGVSALSLGYDAAGLAGYEYDNTDIPTSGEVFDTGQTVAEDHILEQAQHDPTGVLD